MTGGEGAVLEEGGRQRHRRVYARLEREIRGGALEPGTPLPAERLLAERLEVSRTTVRRALRDLVEAGLVEPAPGRGLRVAEPAVLLEPGGTLAGFSEVAEAGGLQAGARVLVAEERPADAALAAQLRIATGDPYFHLERVRLLGGDVVSHSVDRVPVALAPGLPALDFTEASLFAALDAAGAAPARSQYTVEGVLVPQALAPLLEVAPGTAGLQTDSVTVDGAGRVVDVSRAIARADRYRVHMTVQRSRP